MQTDLSTAFAITRRCLSVSSDLEAALENDVGTIDTLFAARTSALSTLNLDCVVIPAADSRLL
jgi:hypothetical protein